MAIELRLKKSDLSEPWGFRLVGGVEFEAPIVVVKVNENSIAEDAGLQVGDQVIRIKNASTAGITHAEVYDLISSAGCELELGVIKGAFVDLIMTVRPIAEREEPTLQKQTDAQIIDPNEQPQPNVWVLQRKKWSTFLQKPKNVKPLCKKQEEERKILGAPYKVNIVKQPKRDLKEKKVVRFQPEVIETDNKTQTFLKESSEEVTEIVKTEDDLELELQTTIKVEEETSIEIGEEDSEENFEADEEIVEIMSKYEDEDEFYPGADKKTEEILKNATEFNGQCIVKIPKPILKVKPMTNDTRSDTTMSLEEQLVAVQKQLLALSQFPSAIQSTLEAVTKQLNEIVTLKNNSESSNEGTELTSVDPQVDPSEVLDENSSSLSENAEADITENDAEDQQFEELPSEFTDTDVREEQEQETSIVEHIGEATPPPSELTEEEKETIKREEEMLIKKQKAMEARKKQDWVERPIVLPGGRKWNGPDDTVPKFRNPKMSDEKIGEMIDPFSEVIVGKTKGVNFLKYQPPPRNLAYLQNSEVYRLIHGMEPPMKGVGFRSEKVLSEKDYIGEQNAL